MRAIASLVINWHLTEACNFRCQYCYAKWDENYSSTELARDLSQTERLLSALYNYFTPTNTANPLRKQMCWDTVRLSLAGGEPLLLQHRLPGLTRFAHALGFEVSLITNASRLDRNMLAVLAPHLTYLGISLDSSYLETNRAIGRADCKGMMIDLEILAEELAVVRTAYLQLKLKLNTVVNKLNEAEDFSPLIARFMPDKWKILRMLPMITNELSVSDDEFNAFVARHNRFADILYPEDNQAMRDSYLMIDPHGRFFQNGQRQIGEGYVYSRPILEVGVGNAFGDISFSPDLFCARYPQPTGSSAK